MPAGPALCGEPGMRMPGAPLCCGVRIIAGILCVRIIAGPPGVRIAAPLGFGEGGRGEDGRVT